MFRKLAATSAAAAVALAGFTAAPARADNDDLLKLLAGAAIIGIIAHESRKDRDRRHTPAPPPAPAPIASITLPAQCITTLRTPKGWRGFYYKRCTDRIMNRRLPEACLRELNTETGPQLAYAEPCLVDRGYRIESVNR